MIKHLRYGRNTIYTYDKDGNEITFIGQLPFITAQENRQQLWFYQKVKGISYGFKVGNSRTLATRLYYVMAHRPVAGLPSSSSLWLLFVNKIGPETVHQLELPVEQPLVVGQRMEVGIPENSLLRSRYVGLPYSFVGIIYRCRG